MTKFEIAMSILGGIGIIGIFILTGMDKSVDVILPVVTTIIGWLVGKTQVVERAASLFKKK